MGAILVVISVGVAAIGIGLLLYPLLSRPFGNAMIRKGVKVQGVVVESEVKDSHASDGVVYKWREERVQFMTEEGRSITGKPSYRDIGMDDRTGQVVMVFYRKENPHEFVAPKNGKSVETSVGPTTALVAVIFILMGLVVLGYSSSRF